MKDDDNRLGRYNENYQSGGGNFNNNGEIHGDVYLGSQERPLHRLPIVDDVVFQIPLRARTLTLGGIASAAAGVLGVAASGVTLFSFGQTDAHPFLSWVSEHFTGLAPFAAFAGGVLVAVIGACVQMKEHAQLGRFTLVDSKSGLQFVRKHTKCPACGGSMQLTTLPYSGDTPFFVCRRDSSHVLKFEYAM